MVTASAAFDPETGFGSALHASSPESHAISHLVTVSFLVCGAIFCIVAGLVTYCAVRFRDRPGAAAPIQTHGNKRLELAWTAVPVLLLVGLFSLTASSMQATDASPAGEADVVVIAHQWWWEARYAGSGVNTANEIHIPVGRRTLVRLESVDVVHDFWVPELARKIDVVPGHPNTLWLEADTAGTYWGACAEYCGTQHAWMRFVVIADAPAAFDAWIAHEKQTAPAPMTESAQRGAAAFRNRTCINCHAIGGVGVPARVAPDLTHLAEREWLGAGVVSNTPEHLASWLKDPSAMKPGTRMPNLQLSDAEVADLTNYLETLK